MRYNYNAAVKDEINADDIHYARMLLYPQIKTDVGSPYIAKVLDAMLPVLIAEKQPQTLEFVSLHSWHRSESSGARILRGVIVRNETGDVLLYSYGIGLDDSMSTECYQAFCGAFNITEEESKQLSQEAWPKLDYSVILHLS